MNFFYIYIQKKNNDMNRQKAEEKGIGRREGRRKFAWAGQGNRQVREIGRAWK